MKTDADDPKSSNGNNKLSNSNHNTPNKVNSVARPLPKPDTKPSTLPKKPVSSNGTSKPVQQLPPKSLPPAQPKVIAKPKVVPKESIKEKPKNVQPKPKIEKKPEKESVKAEKELPKKPQMNSKLAKLKKESQVSRKNVMQHAIMSDPKKMDQELQKILQQEK